MYRACLLLLSMLLSCSVLAQSYPARPVRIIIPFAPGAISDYVARAIGQKFPEVFGQALITENRAGGGTIVGTELVVRSAPDGYTLLLVSVAHAINPAFFEKLPYDALTDLAHVTLVGTAPFVVVVNPALPAKTMKDFIALAKSRPGQLTYGSSGTGGGSHLATELLSAVAGIELTHIPYKGAAPAIVDVLSGQINLTLATITAVGQHVKNGKLRALAVSSKKRLAAAPDLPTVAESCCAQYEASGWWNIAVTAATPRPLVAQLNSGVVKILRMPDVVSSFGVQGVELVGSTPEEALARLKEETVIWGKVIRDKNIKPE